MRVIQRTQKQSLPHSFAEDSAAVHRADQQEAAESKPDEQGQLSRPLEGRNIEWDH